MSDAHVVDASAVVLALAGKSKESLELRERLRTTESHAPHLIDAEVGHALRRGALRGDTADDEARTGLRILPRLVGYRHPHSRGLLQHAWEVRHTISFYDGLYVALAGLMNLPLLTGDVRLANASGLTCKVEVVV